eukprot:COSAG06_NODE_60_length_27159_cov_57.986031_14_plen_64_part_00
MTVFATAEYGYGDVETGQIYGNWVCSPRSVHLRGAPSQLEAAARHHPTLSSTVSSDRAASRRG